MPKIKGQENQRYTDIWVDQVGREYIVNCEKSTGDPIDMRPHLWKAPLSPDWVRNLFTPPCDDHEIVYVVKRIERARNGYQIFVDHDAWLRKVDARNAARAEQLAAMAVQNKGVVTAEMEQYVGPMAFPPREFIQAMKAGNEWALGLSDIVPEKARVVLDKIKPAVIAMGMARFSEADDRDPFAEDVDEVNPFLRDDDDEPASRVLDPLAVEEAYDPQATDGQRVPVGKRRQKAGHAVLD